jgi:hypothetical protein
MKLEIYIIKKDTPLCILCVWFSLGWFVTSDMDILLEAYDDSVCMLVVGMLLFLSESYHVSSVTSFGRGARWLPHFTMSLFVSCVFGSLYLVSS